MRLTILITMLAIFVGACTEEKQEEKILFSGSGVLGKVWQLKSIEVDLGILTPYNCVADNNYTYFSSGRYEVNEGRSKCAETDAPGLSGEYFFNENQDELVINIGDSIRIWDVISSAHDQHKISSVFDGERRSYVFEVIR